MNRRSIPLLALLALLLSPATRAEEAKDTFVRETTKHEAAPPAVPYGYVLISNLPKDSTGKVPLIISLHGAGGGKKGVEGLSLNDETFFAATGQAYLFVKPATTAHWDPDQLNQLIDTILKEQEKVADPQRIYLYGYSMGGHGAWRYCVDHGDRIAAMMAIEGGFGRRGGPLDQYDFKHFKTLPVWAFHNRDDSVVPLASGQAPIDAAKAAGGTPKFTINESGNHKIQLKKNFTQEVLDWLFAQSR